MVELGQVGEFCMVWVHDVMRDLALRNVRGLIGSKRGWDVSKLQFLYEPRWRLSDFPSQWTASTNPLNARALSLEGGDVRILPNNFSARNLQGLRLGGNKNLSALSVGFFQPLSHLRVLDLSWTGIETLSSEIVGHLKALVLLNVNYCTNLRKVSRQLEGLKNLEVICAVGCYKFRYPTLKTLPKLTILTLGLPEKASLQVQLTLSLRGRAHARFLEPHTNLKQLSLFSSGIETIWGTMPLNLQSLTALEELVLGSICWPQGILQLHHLRKIHAQNTVGEIPALDELCALQELRISVHSQRFTELPQSFGRTGAFPALTRLTLGNVKLEHVTFHRGAMPMLDNVELRWFLPGNRPMRSRGLDSFMQNLPRNELHSFLRFLPRSLNELHSLTSFRIWSHYPVENLGELFSDPLNFPNLTRLELCAPLTRPPPLQFLPALSLLVLNIRKKDWPEDVAKLEARGQIEVRVENLLRHRI